MKELLALIVVALAGFAIIWSVIFGLYFLMIGLLFGMGDVYVVLGFLLIAASLFLSGLMSYYLRGKPAFFKSIFDRFKRRN